MKKNIFILVLFGFLFAQCNDKRIVKTEYWNDNNGNKTKVLRFKISSKSGLIDGYCYTYYENGQLRSKTYYENNRLLKILSVYDTLGEPLNYGYLDKNGNGHIIIFDEYTGRKFLSGKMVNGFKEGWWKFIYVDGVAQDSMFFNNGAPDFNPRLKMILY